MRRSNVEFANVIGIILLFLPYGYSLYITHVSQYFYHVANPLPFHYAKTDRGDDVSTVMLYSLLSNSRTDEIIVEAQHRMNNFCFAFIRLRSKKYRWYIDRKNGRGL